MKQITEDYCSFETAKLLKEKGFKNEYCDNMLLAEDGDTIWKFATFTNRDDAFDATMKFKKQIPYVTHQMALKWLREVHNIVLATIPNDHDGIVKWRIEVFKVYKENECLLHEGRWITEAFLPCPEEAVEAALKYTLENLI